jgi:hypothetical protein
MISWLGAVAVSELVVLAIQFTIHRVPPGSLPTGTYIFASNHVAASVVVYGFISFFIVRREGTLIGFLAAMTGAVAVAVTALAGLYFGRFWMADAVAGAALALAWVAIVGVIAVWHRPSVPASRGIMPAFFLLVVVCSMGLQFDTHEPREFYVHPPAVVPALGTEGEWATYRWKQLPCCRADMNGKRLEPFAVQWAAGREDIRRQLYAVGWADSPGLSLIACCRWPCRTPPPWNYRCCRGWITGCRRP